MEAHAFVKDFILILLGARGLTQDTEGIEEFPDVTMLSPSNKPRSVRESPGSKEPV